MPVAGDFYFGQSKIIVISRTFCGLLHSIVAFELWWWRRLLRVPWTARRSVLNIHWKDWCWSSNILATWCKELTHWKRPWCWERLKAREGDDREWDGWMASPTRWTWVWVASGSWWWIGKPGVLQSMGLQRVGRDWASELILTHYFFNSCAALDTIDCLTDSLSILAFLVFSSLWFPFSFVSSPLEHQSLGLWPSWGLLLLLLFEELCYSEKSTNSSCD